MIPLRKKGYLANAFYYCPVSLLKTSYKALRRFWLHTLVESFAAISGRLAAGFVRGRQMRKLVTMILSQLASVSNEVDVPARASRVILLLDFRKAYDRVNRKFRYAALRAFHFDDQFIQIIQRVHTGTTARFSVNGEQLEPVAVRSGIRQGSPSAPLLFLLVVELLVLAIR